MTTSHASIYAAAVAAAEVAMTAAWDKDGQKDGGSCGFAWVHFHNGRHAFAKWAKDNGKGAKHWSRGWYFPISQGARGQGMHIAEAGAAAFQDVLRAAFPEVDIYWNSRVD